MLRSPQAKMNLRRFGVVTASMTVATALSIAFAAWLAVGTGDSEARASTAQILTVTAATATAQLYPGGSGDVRMSISNPNPYPVVINSVAANGAITSDKGAACNNSTGVTFTGQSDLSLAIAANGSATHTLSGAASMSNASHNDCQGAVFTIPVTVSGQSNAQ